MIVAEVTRSEAEQFISDEKFRQETLASNDSLDLKKFFDSFLIKIDENLSDSKRMMDNRSKIAEMALIAIPN